MTIQNLEYWYDGQMRRYLEQLVRAFSGFQYQPGMRNGVQGALRAVPCRLAMTDRMVGYIMRNLSENALQTVPMITLFQTELKGRRDDVQNLGLVEHMQVTERGIVNGTYTGNRGQSYTVDRIMARPFEMTVQVDLWTSNLDQKYQLLEQILTVIYPAFDIQNSVNGIDWTALTTVFVEDITLSSRSLPIGTESEIDVATIILRLPFWLSPPAKVKRQVLIEQIMTNIRSGTLEQPGELMGTVVTTPGDYHVEIAGETVTIKNADGGDLDAQGNPLAWANVLDLYGTFRPGVSRISLYSTPADTDPNPISGTLIADPSAPNQLIWQIDPTTLPASTLQPVSALVDPLRSAPGHNLPSPAPGTRYLLVNDIGAASAWGGLSASANDIVQFTGTGWIVVFDASTTPSVEYVTNTYTGSQLRWTGSEWVVNVGGLYGPGFWRLSL